MYSVSALVFGGLNYADEPTSLLRRSHSFDNGQWNHRIGPTGYPIGLEAAAGHDFDLIRENLVTRKGSTSYADFTGAGLGIFLAADVVVLGPVEVKLPATGAYAQFVVSKKTIYTNQSGAWAQINNSGGTAYTHNDQTVTKASIVVLDGGVFFGLDKTNKIQRYISGTNLAVQMNNGNAYTDSGGTAQTITGTWGTGYYILEAFQGRLVFNDGSSTIQATDTNQPWDLAGGLNFPASGKIAALKVHIPEFAYSLTAVLYIGSDAGWEFSSALTSASTIQGSPPPMKNEMCISTRNWIMYMSDEGGLYAINGIRVIDIGRRYKALDGASGPLDNIVLANTRTVGTAVYNRKKQQAFFQISTAASGAPDTTLVVDMQRGEPLLDDPLISYEQYVRCLCWTGINYISMGMTIDGMIGSLSTGILYHMEDAYSDYGTTAISFSWFSPIMDGGAPINSKNLLTSFWRALRQGNWNPQIDFLLNRDSESTLSKSFNMGTSASVYGTATYGSGTYSSDTLVKYATDVDLICETFQIKLAHAVAAQSIRLTNFEQRYEVLTEER